MHEDQDLGSTDPANIASSKREHSPHETHDSNYKDLGKKETRTLYDDMRRADQAQRGSYQADQTWSYTYDAQGNRRTQTYTTYQEDLRGHYSSKSYEQARQDYYGSNHGTNQNGSYRY